MVILIANYMPLLSRLRLEMQIFSVYMILCFYTLLSLVSRVAGYILLVSTRDVRILRFWAHRILCRIRGAAQN